MMPTDWILTGKMRASIQLYCVYPHDGAHTKLHDIKFADVAILGAASCESVCDSEREFCLWQFLLMWYDQLDPLIISLYNGLLFNQFEINEPVKWRLANFLWAMNERWCGYFFMSFGNKTATENVFVCEMRPKCICVWNGCLYRLSIVWSMLLSIVQYIMIAILKLVLLFVTWTAQFVV